jgi:lambda family phage tail tape measure protein
MGRTLAGSLAALNSGISESILQIGDSAGAMQSLVDNATGVIAAFNGMLPLLVDSNKITQDQADSFQFVADAAEAVAILVGVRLVASMASAALAMNTASFAAVGLRVSMGFLGGPLGAIFLAAGSLVLYASKALEATEKTDLLSKSVDKLTVAGARQRLLQLADSFKTAQDLAEGLKQRLEDTKNVLADNPNNPALVGMLDAVTKSYENAAKKAEEFKRVQKVLTDIVNDPDRSGTIKKQAQALADANKKEVADLLAGNIETEAALAAKKKLFQDSQQFLQGLKTPKELFDDQKALLTLFSETGNDATKRTDDFLISADQLAQGIKLAREEMEQLIESGKVENPLIAQADQFAQSIKTSTQLYDDQIQKLNLWRDTINSATGEALISQQQYRTGVEQARESLDDLNEKAIESESVFGNLQSASERWAESFADSLVEGGLNFENFANGILKQLQKIALQKAFAPMFGEFGNFISGAFTPSVASASPTGADVLGTPFDGGGFTGSGPRSGGVDGKGGFRAILHPNETVIDHTKGQKMGGGSVSVTVNVDASGSSAQGDGDGKKIGNMIGVAVRSVLLEESRPGGLLA